MHTSGLTTINLRGRIWALLFMLLAFSSCETTEDWVADSSGKPSVPKEALLTFRIKDKLYPESYGVKTGEAFDEASFCDSLYVLLFKEAADGWRYERGRTLKKTKQLTNGDYEYTLLLPDDLKDVPLTMLVCANAGEVITSTPDDRFSELPADGGIHKVGRKLAEVENMLVFKVPEDTADPFKSGWYGGGKSNIPMCAQMNNVSFTYDKAGKWTFNNTADGTLNVGLFRSVLRVDVGLNYKFSGQNLLANRVQGLSNFKISALYVAYSSDSVALPPVDAPAVLNVFGSGSVDMMGFRAAAACDSIEQRLYIAETDNNVRTNDKRPCAIVEGEYTPVGTTTPVKGYYRMDFVDSNGDYIVLKRNTLVRFNIKEVKGRGFDTKEQALKSKPSNIDVELTAYTEITGDTHFNGQYYISLSKSEVTMPREKGVAYTVLINTNVEDWATDVKLSVDKTNWADTAADANFSFEKVNDPIKGIRGLKITTLAEWAQDVDVTLYLKAKNMHVILPVMQVNQSFDKWKNGRYEEYSFEQNNWYSQLQFHFPGGSGIQNVSYYTLFSQDTSVQIDAANSWLTWVLTPSGDLSLQVKPNLTGVTREAVMTITPRAGDITTDIKVVQESCLIKDILSSKGVLWAFCNYGATSTTEGISVPSISDQYCPSGWHVAMLHELINLWKKQTPNIEFNDTTGTAWCSAQNAFFTLPEGKYLVWNAGSATSSTLKLQYTGSTTSLPGPYIRCVKSFKMKQYKIFMPMDGSTQHIDYYALNNERLTTPIQQDGFIVSDAGSNLLKVEAKPNLSDKSIITNIAIPLDPDVDAMYKGEIYIIQNAMCKPSVDKDGEYLKVGDTEWYPWNVGATVSYSEYASVVPDDTGQQIYVTKDTVQVVKEASGDKPVINTCGERMSRRAFDNGKKCPKGWRLPSVYEWEGLLKRMKVVNIPIPKPNPTINRDSVTIFFATDNHVVTYFPLGYTTLLPNNEDGVSDIGLKGVDSYLCSDYSYVLRKYNQPQNTSLPKSLHLSKDGDRYVLMNERGQRIHYARCVRTIL